MKFFKLSFYLFLIILSHSETVSFALSDCDEDHIGSGHSGACSIWRHDNLPSVILQPKTGVRLYSSNHFGADHLTPVIY